MFSYTTTALRPYLQPARQPNPSALQTTAIVALAGAAGYGIYRVMTDDDGPGRKKACGDKYRHLVVTASGYTPENPGGSVPFVDADVYPEWHALAKKLATEAYARFIALGTLECQKTGGTGCGTDDVSGGSYPKWNSLLDLNDRVAVGYDELSDPTWVLDREQARGEAQAVIANAICLMEAADDAIAFYEGNVPVTPGTLGLGRSTVPWWIWGLGVAGAFAGGVALHRYYQSKRRERSAPPAGRRAAPRSPEDPGLGSRMAESALAQSRGAA